MSDTTEQTNEKAKEMNRTKKTKKEGDFVMTHTLNQIMLLMETTLSAAYDAFAATIIYMLT